MKNFRNFIIEKLNLSKAIIADNNDKLENVPIGGKLYLLLITKNKKSEIVRSSILKCVRTRRMIDSECDDEITIKLTDAITKTGYTPTYTFVKGINYDSDSVIAGLIMPPVYYFIATDESYFDELKDENLFKRLSNEIHDGDMQSSKQLKKFLDKNLKINQ